MIQRAHITAWRSAAPWATDAQIEQDLVICRALVEIYADPMLARALAFRGGTALHKLFLTPPSRYSEDIDLVRVGAGPAGDIMSVLRARLDPRLGPPRWKQTEGRITFVYRFSSEIAPITPLKLKVEINTREIFSVLGHERRRFAVASPWFTGEADILTYRLEELLGTKLRALYQRRKGRDLFDLDLALRLVPTLDLALVVACCERYLAHEETTGIAPLLRGQPGCEALRQAVHVGCAATSGRSRCGNRGGQRPEHV